MTSWRFNPQRRSCRLRIFQRARTSWSREFEDIRLFAWRGGLWCCGTVRELTPEGWCEQVLARIDDSSTDHTRLTDWRLLHPPGPRLHEKNWMPQVAGDACSSSIFAILPASSTTMRGLFSRQSR